MKLDFRKPRMSWANSKGSITVTHTDYAVHLTVVNNTLNPKSWKDNVWYSLTIPKYYGMKEVKKELYDKIERYKKMLNCQ